MEKILIVIIGPTAIGKTSLAIEVAQRLNTEIISADSRQFYEKLKIGVAAPTEEELKAAKHYFIGHLKLDQYYNVSRFENEVIHFLDLFFRDHDTAVMVGGSGLYIDAVCEGIDELPDPDEQLRAGLKDRIEKEGLDSLKVQLEKLDPEYYQVVDLNNPNRIMRALEVCLQTGKTFTSQRIKQDKSRNFRIIKIGLDRPREELFPIIEQRVDNMIEAGLVEEVKSLVDFRELNSLNSVGYKEIFKYLDGEYSLNTAIEKIKTNTRRYAKRQLTWFKRDKAINWFHPDEKKEIFNFLKSEITRKSHTELPK